MEKITNCNFIKLKTTPFCNNQKYKLEKVHSLYIYVEIPWSLLRMGYHIPKKGGHMPTTYINQSKITNLKQNLLNS